jgi:tetratricopeptide (TPR) repeat protein
MYDLMLKIASLREQKGKEQEVLALIKSTRENLMQSGEHEKVVDLYWEEYLVGKHLLMDQKDKSLSDGLEFDAKQSDGFRIMKDAAQNSLEYIERNNVESKMPRLGRFLGEVSMIEGDYDKAVEHFKQSIDLFRKDEDPRQRVNALELSGFLAEVLVYSGRLDEAIQTARDTFKAYDVGDGEALKNNDYYTWAVWKSGCPIKVWHAVIENKVVLEDQVKQELLNMLDEAEKILVIPEGQETWGDKNFEFRKKEIEAIRKHLS